MIIDIKNKNSINIATDVLRRNGILVFPTDTVYGIGCLLNDRAIKQLYKIKNRPLDKPTAVLMTNNQNQFQDILSRYPKGKVTVVADAKNFKIKFPKILLKDNKIGVRFPNFPWLERLIEKVGPIVASSANKKGKPAPKKFEEIRDEILEETDLTIKTSEALSGKPSAVYDIENNKVLR